MQSKTTPTKRGTQKPRPAPQPAPIAELLAAVLAHPDLPEFVYDGIIEGLDNVGNEVYGDYTPTPEHLRWLFDNYRTQQGALKALGLAKRKGGAK